MMMIPFKILKSGDKFTYNSLTYRKLLLQNTNGNGRVNAQQVDTGEKLYIPESVKVTPIDQAWRKRRLPSPRIVR